MEKKQQQLGENTNMNMNMGLDLKSRRRRILLLVGLLMSVMVVTLIYFNKDHRSFDGLAYMTNSWFGGNIKQKSCLSREAISSYRKPSPHNASAYLLTKLQDYEELHHRCGPKTRPYRRTMIELTMTNDNKKKKNENDDTECRYVVWRAAQGLGNQMVSMASAFLYALLTNRVLLVDFGADDANLFCEPFVNSTSSWILPSDFPHKKNRFRGLKTFQNLMKENQQQQQLQTLPNFLYVDLVSGSSDRVKYFHCDKGHSLLQRIPVLVMQSDLYYAPSLFMSPSFKKELDQMFPEKTTVFHHLGRYLFHPSDQAWEHISDYYDRNLAKADVKIGLQIRVVNSHAVTPQVVMNQILSCSQKYHILPNTTTTTTTTTTTFASNSNSSTAILVASLFSEYAKNLTATYKYKNTTGGVVKVYQPSAEGHQKFNDAKQNMKAWVEMYLLSLCDKLVTTGESTFGYVAEGLGGVINPWVLRKQDRDTSKSVACWRAPTIDPCFQFPPGYDCNANKDIGHVKLAHLFPQIKLCEDRWFGFRLSDGQ